MELKDYIRVIRRRFWWFLAVIIVVMGGYTAVASLTEKRIYRSKVDLVITPTRAVTLLQSVQDYYPDASKVNYETRVAFLSNEETAERAALYLVEARAGADGDYLFADERRQADAMVPLMRETLLQTYVEAHPEMPREDVARTFQDEMERIIFRKMEIDPKTGRWTGEMGQWQEEAVKRISHAIGGSYEVAKREKTQIVQILVQSDSPHKVAAVTNALADAAVSLNAEIDTRGLKEAGEKLAARVEFNKGEMQRIRLQIKEFWKSRQAGVTGDFYTSEHFYARLAALQKEYGDLKAQLREQDDRIARMQSQREFDRRRFVQFMPAKDSPLATLRVQKMQEEKRLDALRERYTEAHPDIKQALANLERMDREYSDELRKLHENQAIDFENQRATIEFEKDRLREEIAQKEAEIKECNDLRTQFDQNRLDEQELQSRLKAYEDENRRLTEYRGLSELYADASTTSVARVRPNSRVEFKDVREQPTDVFHMMWFMFVVAFLLSLGVVFLVEYMDTTLKTEHDIRRHLNLPVLGIIQHQESGESVLLTELPVKDPFAEKFYTAATIVKSASQDLGLRTFVVSSTIPKEGKTTITVNLGVALARKGLKVIVVDSDLRIPQIHELMGLDNSYGLSSILEGRLKAREVLSDIASGPARKPAGIETFLQPTAEPNLKILTSGPIPADPLNLLESVRMKALLEELKGMADFILLDTPPLFNVGDTLTLAGLCDANIFVVGAGAVEQHLVTWAKHLLSNVEANVLGCFLNHATIEGRSYYYYYNEYKSYRARG